MLAHEFASTSSRNIADIRPARSFTRPRGPVRIVAAATFTPSKSVDKSAVVLPKGSTIGPGQVFLSSTRAAAGQIWGVLKFFQAEEEAALSPETDSNILQETAERAEEVGTSTYHKGHFAVQLTPCAAQGVVLYTLDCSFFSCTKTWCVLLVIGRCSTGEG